jgi:hypothetical protein
VADFQLLQGIRDSPASSVLIIGYDTDNLTALDIFATKRAIIVPTKGISRIDNDTVFRFIDLGVAFAGLHDIGLTTSTLLNSAAAVSGGDYFSQGVPGMGIKKAAQAAKDDPRVTTLPHLLAKLGVDVDMHTARRLSVQFLTSTHCLSINESGK